jgi:hypothetical protein
VTFRRAAGDEESRGALRILSARSFAALRACGFFDFH